MTQPQSVVLLCISVWPGEPRSSARSQSGFDFVGVTFRTAGFLSSHDDGGVASLTTSRKLRSHTCVSGGVLAAGVALTGVVEGAGVVVAAAGCVSLTVVGVLSTLVAGVVMAGGVVTAGASTTSPTAMGVVSTVACFGAVISSEWIVAAGVVGVSTTVGGGAALLFSLLLSTTMVLGGGCVVGGALLLLILVVVVGRSLDATDPVDLVRFLLALDLPAAGRFLLPARD